MIFLFYFEDNYKTIRRNVLSLKEGGAGGTMGSPAL